MFYPLLKTVSQVTPSPFDTIVPKDRQHPIEPRLSYAEIIRAASAESSRRGWSEPAGGVVYSPEFGVYGISSLKPGDDHGAGGVGPAALYYNNDGRVLGERKPWRGTAADIFVQAQFPLHSGRILVSFMGIVVAMLSVTGVIIWWHKRAARRTVARRHRSALVAS